MSAKRPSSTEILGQQFKIEHLDHIPAAADEGVVYGETDSLKRSIKMKKTDDDDSYESTLLHETIHGILGISGLTELLEGNMEEALVLALENGLHKLYKRR